MSDRELIKLLVDAIERLNDIAPIFSDKVEGIVREVRKELDNEDDSK